MGTVGYPGTGFSCGWLSTGVGLQLERRLAGHWLIHTGARRDSVSTNYLAAAECGERDN